MKNLQNFFAKLCLKELEMCLNRPGLGLNKRLKTVKFEQYYEAAMLYTLTSKQVLHTRFAGINHLDLHFLMFFHQKEEKG